MPLYLTGEVVNAVQFTDVFQLDIVNTLVDVMKSMTSLFTIFPINLLLIGGPILGVAFGIFRKAKRTATGK